jgi:BlaI family transcriptional regulator, penicillinase repressor
MFVIMPRLPSATPTEVELHILRVLWERGPQTVREIHDALSALRSTGYSTTLKMVQVMTEKGLVLRDDAQRPQVYRPARPQEQTQLQMLDYLIQQAFGGSAMKLVLRAAAAKRIAPAELAEIKKLIERAKPSSKGDKP